MRILVFGAGVIGSVYAEMLLRAGHEVVLLARGRRLSELRSHGLVLEDGWSGTRTTRPVEVTGDATSGGPFDLVLVSVRAGQLEAVLPGLAAMNDGSDVLFFGNTAGRDDQLVAMLGERAVFGFPAVGGVRDGPTIRYVLISQQSTMVGEANGTSTARVHLLRRLLEKAGFPTKISTDIQAWLLAHAAFVVPVAFALYRTGISPAQLADDPDTLRTMVLATRGAFLALRAAGNTEIPMNLQMLYLRLPAAFAARYWRRVMAGPRGELWFAAHCRAAPEEMRALAAALVAALDAAGHVNPELARLLGAPTEPPMVPG